MSKVSQKRQSSSQGGSPSKQQKTSGGKKLDRQFFQKSCEDLAKALLGKKIVRKLDDGKIVSGHIVETEAYLGGADKASHSFEGKKSAKNEAMFMDPGTIYVYHIYGVMTCVNISSQGEGAAVLIRAVDPVDGQDIMRKSRGQKRSDKGEGMKVEDFGSGPSKLTQALSIDKATFNKADIVDCDVMWLEEGFHVDADDDIVESARIGVDYAGEWAKKPLRFYVNGNRSVSSRDKDNEKKLKKSKSVVAENSQGSSSSKRQKTSGGKKLDRQFFQKSAEDLAKALLGKKIVRELDDGQIVSGHIVETEAYLGGADKASHSFEGKKSTKNEATFMDPGTLYVHNIYGVMACVNISSQGEGASVLIRAVDPVDGQDIMRKSRGQKRSDKGEGMKVEDFGSGPSKLTQALSIDKATFNKADIVDCDVMWLEEGFQVDEDDDIVESARIGVDYAGEWAKKPLRFYVNGNRSVSSRDKDNEKKLKKSKSVTKTAEKLETKASSSAKSTSSELSFDKRLPEKAFDRECTDLAKYLLGKTLVRQLDDGQLLAGHIVETEAYLGGDDKASHSYNGHRTSKNEAMFMPPGSMCVYNMYGTMTCLKFSSKGEGAAVLLRAIDPTVGQSVMRKSRGVKRADKGDGMKDEELGSGPSKLTQALSVDRATFNKDNIADADGLWVQDGGLDVGSAQIVTTRRVGVDGHGGDWADKPLRFYVRGNKSVSVRDKAAE